LGLVVAGYAGKATADVFSIIDFPIVPETWKLK
jgi:hypothetical protein